MNKLLLAAIAAASTLSSAASADTTIGFGLGSLYSGIGVNFGTTTATTLSFVSVGCLGVSIESSSTDNGSVTERTDGDSYNCGAGFGHVSTALLPGNRQGLGISLIASNNNVYKNNKGSNLEVNLMPSYYFFFKGIDKSGFNLGAGAAFGYREGQEVEAGMSLSVGYQF